MKNIVGIGWCMAWAACLPAQKSKEIYEQPAAPIEYDVGHGESAYRIRVTYPANAFETDTLFVAPDAWAVKEKSSLFGNISLQVAPRSFMPDSKQQAERDAIGLSFADKMNLKKSETHGEHGFLVALQNDKKTRLEVTVYIPTVGEEGVVCKGSHTSASEPKDMENWITFLSNTCKSVNVLKAPGASAKTKEVKVPEGWPGEIPIYKGKLKDTSTTSTSSSVMLGVTVTSTDLADTVQSFYQAAFKKAGYTETSNSHSGGVMSRSYTRKWTETAMVMTSVLDGATTLTLSLSLPTKRK